MQMVISLKTTKISKLIFKVEASFFFSPFSYFFLITPLKGGSTFYYGESNFKIIPSPYSLGKLNAHNYPMCSPLLALTKKNVSLQLEMSLGSFLL